MLIALAGAVAVAACSADITRFDTPGFRLSDEGSTGSLNPRGANVGPLSAQTPARSGSGSAGAFARGDSSVRSAALPDVMPPDVARDEPASRPSRRDENAFEPVSTALRPERPATTGPVIAVERGDTLYGLSRRHGVSLAELMSVNELTSPDLRPGQKLRLPASASLTAPSPRSLPARDSEAATAPADWTGSHTVASGETLSTIARRYGIRSADLQRYNGIEDPRRMRPGLALKVPGGGSSVASSRGSAVDAPDRYAAAPADPATDVPASAPAPVATGVRTVAIEPDRSAPQPDAPAPSAAEGRSANAGSDPSAPAPAVVAKSDKLRWPARGRIIGSFGPRSDGTHNDGVNLAVPMGAEVHAAEDGVVAYAGSELRGYGNLVLVRHDNGWVTAYAHNQDLLVKRGDVVKRGQVIAKAGKSGDVDQPQLHFELRQGSKPVDPLPHLETL
ncbi:MAG: peptidoglycan DD-metalloendopeptidase family protein [Hyphomicrobiaceae bacterium]|nr:peptidoglycan DD-metalloendopeptidase family protein [Hyphomicrobiaceae bacterium]